MLLRHEALADYLRRGRGIREIMVSSENLPRVDKLFEESDVRTYLATGNFVCGASQLLSLYPSLARYFQIVATGHGVYMEHVRSLLALLDVMDLLVMVRLGRVTPPMLALALKVHADLYVACYGNELVRPTYHDAQHLPRQLGHFGTLLTCFTHENVVEGITIDQIQFVSVPCLKDGLHNPISPPKHTLSLLAQMFPGRVASDFIVASSGWGI